MRLKIVFLPLNANSFVANSSADKKEKKGVRQKKGEWFPLYIFITSLLLKPSLAQVLIHARGESGYLFEQKDLLYT